MGALLRVIIKTAIQLLAGVGVGAILDKVAADKLPGYPKGSPIHLEPVLDPEGNPTGETQFSLRKVLYFLGAGIIGVFLIRFIAKKMNITILK